MITNHRLDGADWIPTVHTSGWIKPDLILIHDTTSRLEKGRVVNYLKQNNRKVSYHIVIERDGTIVQMAPFNRRCHHAGRSSYQGREWCNGFSVGVGLVSPGALKGKTDKAKSWFGEVYIDGVVEKKSPHHGSSKLWLEYTDQQLMALDEVVRNLRSEYGDIPIAGHVHVSPGRKVDPGAHLDLAMVGAEPIEVEPEQPTAKDVLSKTSRKYKITKRAKHVLGGLTLAGTGTEIAKAASIEKISATKAYFDVIGGFVSSYGIPMLIAGGVIGWLVTEYLAKWQEEDLDSGRYEGSGDWK